MSKTRATFTLGQYIALCTVMWLVGFVGGFAVRGAL